MSGAADTTGGAGPEPVGLVRDLGLFDITMVGVGAMIGAGIFVLTGIAAASAGPALILAFALNGIVTVFTAMVYAELGSAIPEAGGGYLWVKEGMPAWNAFIAGWMSWFAHAVAGSLYALGFGSYVEFMLSEFDVTSLLGITGPALHKSLAVAVALVFVAINFKGVSETGTVGNLVTVGKVLILALFVGSGMLVIFGEPGAFDRFVPFAARGFSGILVAMGLTFIAFEGYEIIVQAGEEVKNPRETIPKAVFLSLAIVIPIYMLVAFAAVGAVDPESGEASWRWLGEHAELGLAEAAREFMPLGTTLLLVGGLLSTMSALNATTFSSTRVSFAMGRDRNLPDAFGSIHETTRTPWLALLCSGGLIVFMAVSVPIEDVAAAADIMFLLLFLQVNVAVITIRRKYGDKLDYGYLIPFFPVVPIIGIVSKLFLAVFMFNYSPLAWFTVLGWTGVGLAIYFAYARGREREKELTPVVLERRAWAPSEKRLVLVPVPEEGAPILLAVAARLARPLDAEILLLHIATVAPQSPLSAGRRRIESARELISDLRASAEDLNVPIHSVVRLGHRPSTGIVDTVAERETDWVVMGWHRRVRRGRHLGRNLDPVMQETAATVLAVQDGVEIPPRRVLVPIARPRTAARLLGIARVLADADAEIVALHVVRPDLPESDREERLDELRETLSEPGPFEDVREEGGSAQDPRVEFRVVDSDSVAHAVGRESEGMDVVLVGSTERSWFRRRVFGRTPYWAARRAQCPVILVNHGTHPIKFSFQTFFQFFREEEPEGVEEEG